MLSCYISHYIPKIYWLNSPFWGKILVFLVSSQDFHHPLPKWQGLVFLSPASPCHRRGAMVEATWWILFFGSELDSAVERLVSFLGKKNETLWFLVNVPIVCHELHHGSEFRTSMIQETGMLPLQKYRNQNYPKKRWFDIDPRNPWKHNGFPVQYPTFRLGAVVPFFPSEISCQERWSSSNWG